jgi:hypothetical protein
MGTFIKGSGIVYVVVVVVVVVFGNPGVAVLNLLELFGSII